LSLHGKRVGFALTGSHCTLDRAFPEIERLVAEGADVTPIVSEAVSTTETRFGIPESWFGRLHQVTGKRPLKRIAEVEPLATQVAGLPDRSFAMTAGLAVDMDRGDIDISDLLVNLLGATVKGDVHARNIQSETPGLKGKLDASGPDLPHRPVPIRSSASPSARTVRQSLPAAVRAP